MFFHQNAIKNHRADGGGFSAGPPGRAGTALGRVGTAARSLPPTPYSKTPLRRFLPWGALVGLWGPRGPREGPKRTQGAPQEGPRRAPGRPERAPREPKGPPRGPQEGRKRTPEGSKTAPGGPILRHPYDGFFLGEPLWASAAREGDPSVDRSRLRFRKTIKETNWR